MQRMDLTGTQFGILTVVKIDDTSTTKQRKWLCQCACGNVKTVFQSNLTTGKTRSCGCNQHPGKHNKCGTPIYKIWGSMIQRCTNNNDRAWEYYGSRGVTVSGSWRKFENFYEDMGDPPAQLTLDRIDNSLGYCKENCAWVSRKRQSRNTRANFKLKYKGEKLTFIEWSEKIGLSKECIRGRYRRGWPIEKILTTPKIKIPWNKKRKIYESSATEKSQSTRQETIPVTVF